MIATLLLARVDEPRRAELAALGDLELTLERLVRFGMAAHPDVPVAVERWTEHLSRHLHLGGIAQQLAEMRADDVQLVLGCLAGNQVALRRLDARLRGVSGQALAGIRLGALSIDELLQDVREKLLVSEAGAGKLASYSGRGPIDGWLRVTVARTALNATRGSARRPLGDAELRRGQEIASTDDPQLEALRARCGPAVERAIERGIASLSDDERVLLRLQVVDGLSIDDLATMYGVHRATVARRVARVRTKLFEDVRERVNASLGLEEGELASLMGVMMSAVDVTLGGLLRSESAP